MTAAAEAHCRRNTRSTECTAAAGTPAAHPKNLAEQNIPRFTHHGKAGVFLFRFRFSRCVSLQIACTVFMACNSRKHTQGADVRRGFGRLARGERLGIANIQLFSPGCRYAAAAAGPRRPAGRRRWKTPRHPKRGSRPFPYCTDPAPAPQAAANAAAGRSRNTAPGT